MSDFVCFETFKVAYWENIVVNTTEDVENTYTNACFLMLFLKIALFKQCVEIYIFLSVLFIFKLNNLLVKLLGQNKENLSMLSAIVSGAL